LNAECAEIGALRTQSKRTAKMPVPLRGTAATKSKSNSTAKSRRDAGATKAKSIPRLAHAGDYYGDVVGLFGSAGPLFCSGY
jgi:hypothetical protein